ncbi:MAG: wax ester/triacylglycerol synthase family O-acyltransferase [Myxococcota bacterium]|nr:wax ester/triacylglycerol synthase family O-acyltransferase [Myxococcota bacterium]
MSSYAYDRLTALDSSFLVLERPNAYMHVASTQVFAAGPLRRPDGGIDAEAIKRATAASLHRIPRYRQKLAWIPLQNHPVWVDDERFNIDYHMRHTSLPRPGSLEQLKRLSARIMQQHLDRERPLWEMWIVEGLEEDRFALISKVHHCMIDGVSGVDLMRILMSVTPEQEVPEAPAFVPRPQPSGLDLLGDELWRRAGVGWSVARGLGQLLGEARERRREWLVRARALAEQLGATLRGASETPLNREIGPHRRFDWMALPIAEIKEIRQALGGSLNDVVLAVVTGAVRRFLARRGVSTRGLEFRVMSPVSVRAADEQGALGNRVSAWVVDLPVDEADPRVQLRRIAERTRELKQAKQAVGADVLTQISEWTPSTLLALGARNATRLLPFNLVVTNVPGPQFPMYMLGAKMLETYPHVPLMDRLGLGIALLSYDGRIFWGFNADYDLVPDLEAFVRDTREAFGQLRTLAGAAVAVEAAATGAARRRRRSNGTGRRLEA